MTTQEYISSGILEAYVLGALSREEAMQVEKMARQHTDIQIELRSIEEAMGNYAQAHAVRPPDRLKTRLLSTIASEQSDNTKVLQLHKKIRMTQYWAAASIALAILSSGFGIYSYTRWMGAEERLVSLEQKNAVIANQVNLEKAALEKNIHYSSELIAMLTDSATAKIKMGAVDSVQNYLAEVYWNKQQSSVFLKVGNLPTPPSDKQYQLWALVNGVPVDAGVFDLTDHFQEMKKIEGAQAFAVTLEEKGGKPTPNLEALYLMGKL